MSDNVNRTISPRDGMLDAGQEDAYFSVGREALSVCKEILGVRVPRRIVDFPSGHGRVLRWFKAEWPEAEIFAVEIDRDALAFTADTFNAIPIVADPNLDMQIPDKADLIFSGSLLTHLDVWQWEKFLPMCVNALADDGTLIFTIHGRVASLLAQDRHPMYGNMIDTAELYRAYKAEGFSFAPYSKEYPTFGLTLSSPSWVMRQIERIPNAKIVSFHEQRWGQDVVALRKNPWPLVRP